MQRAVTLVFSTAAVLCCAVAAADSPTPLISGDVGHWLNLEYRAGTLAPEIAADVRLMESIVIVERSFKKIDSYLEEHRQGDDCSDLGLPYLRSQHDAAGTATGSGSPRAAAAPSKHREVLPVRICSSAEIRAVMWEHEGALFIIARLRNDFGEYASTYYVLYQVTADDRRRTSQRNHVRATKGREPRPPNIRALYVPPIYELRPPGQPSLRERLVAAMATPPETMTASSDTCPGCLDGGPHRHHR